MFHHSATLIYSHGGIDRGHFAAYIGIDWSDQKHNVCLVDTSTGSLERSIIKHTPEALDEWASTLRIRFSSEPVAICLEQSRGPLISALLKYDFLVLYPINPKTLAKFREAFSPSRAKDDPRDAEYRVARPSSRSPQGVAA